MNDYTMFISVFLLGVCFVMILPFVRCVYHALRVSIRYSIKMINTPVRKEYSEWDKLWFMPKLFISKFMEILISYLKGWEVQ